MVRPLWSTKVDLANERVDELVVLKTAQRIGQNHPHKERIAAQLANQDVQRSDLPPLEQLFPTLHKGDHESIVRLLLI